ncbi:hypothetical protein CAPTEDRAFT_92131, partial [Capitella teleta]
METTASSVTATGDASSPNYPEKSILVEISKYLQLYMAAIILAFGISCNILSLITLTRPAMRRQSTSLYFSALAVADTFCLTAYGFNLWYGVEPYCHYIGMLMSASTSFSAMLVVMVTTERALVVWFPLKANTWRLRRWATVLVPIAVVVAFGMYIPRIIYRGAE